MCTPRQFPDDSSPAVTAPSAAHPFGGKTPADTAAERTAGLTDNSLMEALAEPAATAPLAADNADNIYSAKVTAEDTQPVVQAIRREWKYRINAAKALWNRLTERELLKPEAGNKKHDGGMRPRHQLGLDKARQQLKDFFVSSKS